MPPGAPGNYPMGPPNNMDPNFGPRMPMTRGMQPGMQQQPPYGPPNMTVDPNTNGTDARRNEARTSWSDGNERYEDEDGSPWSYATRTRWQ